MLAVKAVPGLRAGTFIKVKKDLPPVLLCLLLGGCPTQY